MKTLLAILFLLILAIPAQASRGSFADCASDWTSPISGDACYDTTASVWLYYDGSNWLPVPLQTTVANLPSTCTAGQKAYLTSGDASGNIVQCDGSNTWYGMAWFERSEIDGRFPPWNLTAGSGVSSAVKTANSTGFQAMLDKHEAQSTGSTYDTYIAWYGGQYEFDTAVLYSTTSTTCNFNMRGMPGSDLTVLVFDLDGTYGMRVQSTGGSCNNVRVTGIHFRGGDTNIPTTLFSCTSCAQVKFTGNYCRNWETYCYWNSTSGTAITIAENICASTPASYSGTPACFKVDSTKDTKIVDNQSEPNAADTAGTFIEMGGSGNYRNTIARNGSNADARCIFITGTGDINGLDISENGCLYTTQGIQITATTGAGINRGIVVAGNSISDGTPAAGQYGLNIQDTVGTVVTKNTILGSQEGLLWKNNTGGTFALNQFNTIADDCVDQIEGNVYSKFENNTIYGGCGGNIIGPDGAASTGPNDYGGWILADATSQADTVDFTDFAASDTYTLPRIQQVITCNDSGDANPATSPTDEIWAEMVGIVNSDADGCDVTATFSNLRAGQRLQVRTLSSAGGTVGFSNDGGTTCQDFSTAQMGIYEYYNSALNYLRGAGATGAC